MEGLTVSLSYCSSVLPLGGLQQWDDPVLVDSQAGAHLPRVTGPPAQESRESGPVHEGKVVIPGPEAGRQSVVGFLLGESRITHEAGGLLGGQEIEDFGTAIHAAGNQRTLLLGEIEEMDLAEGELVEIEVSPEADTYLEQSGQ